MDNKLHEGCKAMIIGARSDAGRACIGKIVDLVKYIPPNEDVMHNGLNFFLKDSDGWIVEGEGLFVRSYSGKIFPGTVGCFAPKHLMPLPPLEDPGIDDCTFTPIKNQQPVNA